MKYEAKAWNDANTNSTIDGGDGVTIGTHVPVSIADNQPWRSIDGDDAAAECESLGANYHLISNPEWLSIARDVEDVDSNWTGGNVGNGCLFRGNSGETTCGYNAGADPEGGSGRNARASFTLSNSEVILDFAGNMTEWTDWDKDTAGFQVGPTSCAAGGYIELTSIVCGALGSTDYDTSNGGYISTEGVGKFAGGAGGAAIRGGHWYNAANVGAFNLNLTKVSTDVANSIGFRCVWRP
jgi:formylglycine-generating enzyme required for sulfatase activity